MNGSEKMDLHMVNVDSLTCVHSLRYVPFLCDILKRWFTLFKEKHGASPHNMVTIVFEELLEI